MKRRHMTALGVLAAGAIAIGGAAVAAGSTRAASAGAPTETCVTPASVTNSDGSITQTWTTSDGKTDTHLTPPANFHPATATNQELERFGIPDRPARAGPALQAWLSEWGNAKFAPMDQVCTGNVFGSR